MNKKHFIQLLHRYSGTGLTKDEREFVESYYNLFRNEPDILGTLDDQKKNKIKNNIKDQIWDKIINMENRGRMARLRQRRNIWIAAAVIVLILAMRVFFTYDYSDGKELPENITVKHEENRIIFLADGSKIVLNIGSRLNYPSSFDGKNIREVYLEGQAFFDIQHNADKPFIVHTGNLQTVVLGTAFNINAILMDKEITVSVVRGKVKITDRNKVLGMLTPNQEIKYNTQQDNSEMKVIQDAQHLDLDWKSRDLLLDNATVAEAAKILEEKLKVKIIVYGPSIKSQRFTATFPGNGSLDQALKDICEFNGCTYHYDKNSAIITIKSS